MADPAPSPSGVIPNNFYYSGGIYQIAPGTNTPTGAQALSAADFISGANAHIDQYSSGQYANDPWSQHYVQTLRSAVSLAQGAASPSAMGAGNSGYSWNNGQPTQNSQIAQDQANEAAVVAGTMRKVPIGSGYGYIPIGSPADRLYNGQNGGTLADIIGGNGASATPTPGSTYTIKSGDTLSQLATSFGTTVDELAKLNGIADPNKIIAGATLKLPNFKTIIPSGTTGTGITSTESLRNQGQISDLQAQKDALAKYNLTDTTQLTKAADGSYVPTMQALTDLANGKLSSSSAMSALEALIKQGAPTLKDLDGKPVTEATLLTHLQAANGVAGLKTQLNDVNALIADANLALRQGIYDEEGKLKSMAAMSSSERRMSQQSALTLDALNNRAKTITDQLNTANDVVKQMMDAANQEYTNATNAYNSQYTHAIQLQQLLDSESNVTVDNARANLTIMMNTVADSGATPSATALQNMNMLATQAGWPTGLLAQVLSSGIGKIDYTTTGYDANGNQVVSFFSKAGGGKLIKSVTTPGVKAQPQPSQASTLQQATVDISKQLQGKAGQDGKVAPKDYNEKKNTWQAEYGLSGQSFDNAFSGMTDVTHLQDYNINY